MTAIRRVLVANRGEIAIRVLRACQDLGIDGVAVFSDADVGAPHVRYADHAERIGPPAPAESYLSIDAILDAARRSGADAIHPGYGFLSENADFARAVEAAGLQFIGPPAECLDLLGDKVAARSLARAAGVPVVPGVEVDQGTDLLAALEALRFPVLVKAAAGGGGRGMRRVDIPDELPDALRIAADEARAAFGRPTVYIEQVIESARHVEVQLLGDRHGTLISLGERDCSVQRRHQKLVEESPAPSLDGDLRQRIAADARQLAASIPFHSAATVEFLVDQAGHHYFLEVNTRLQVEHGVTELVTGVDLVAWQIRIAAGAWLPPDIGAIQPRGHAIEVRVYAEDPWSDFGPSGGSIGTWQMPAGPGVRVESGAEAGMDLPPQYDPLLAKILVYGDDRTAALARLRRALDETWIGGVATDLGFHRWLVDEPAFLAGGVDTGFVADRWRSGPDLAEEAAAAIAAAISERAAWPISAPVAPGQAPLTTAWAVEGRREVVEP
jgi:acetyl/propionyl-CoA carboxylase alpha subunit